MIHVLAPDRSVRLDFAPLGSHVARGSNFADHGIDRSLASSLLVAVANVNLPSAFTGCGWEKAREKAKAKVGRHCAGPCWSQEHSTGKEKDGS